MVFKKLWFYRYTTLKYSFDIPYELYHNANVFFAHRGRGTIINPLAKIGEGTYIQHGVTIGVRDDRKEQMAPVIGKNCYIGARAIIIGGITIGDNCKIGAGSVVVKSVPDNCTVVGIPAKIIKSGSI